MKQAQVLNEIEFKRVVAMVRDGKHRKRNEVALCLSFWVGLRVCEIAALKVSDVYEADGTVKEIVNLSASQTKGGNSRQVIINQKMQKLLRVYCLQAQSCNFDGPLLPSQKSQKHFSSNSLCQVFWRIYKQAGLSNASSHSGRRTFITRLANASVNAKVIMSLAGHKNLSTTQRYIEVNPKQLLSAVNLV
ncbi:site-specific integrase [Alteromonas sediminis]|uniref:Site-specific integrase n=1 Tax=Alteromonas sediminis TaxID=2259342 RepID=A0A3N5Y386_9ALTE|nr:site-specific integrase [Alteromonas sediminis]RPJ67216.1 site-specific integrase [Alteromonas sediminis]